MGSAFPAMRKSPKCKPQTNRNENDMSSAVEIPIWVATPTEKRPLMAWARSTDAPLACHPAVDLYGEEYGNGYWTITHRKTGHKVNPSQTNSKDAALALIDVYTPLTAWDAITEPDTNRSRVALIAAVERAYEQFVHKEPVSTP